MNFDEVLQQVYLGNPLSSWLLAVGIFLGVVLLLWAVQRLFQRRLRKLAEGTDSVADNLLVAVLDRTRPLFLLTVAIWAGSRTLDLPEKVHRILMGVTFVVVLLQVGIWATTALVQWLDLVREKKEREKEALAWLNGVEWLGKFAIWTVVLLIALENLGVDVTGLATGLGIGGIAVALAIQQILGDLLAAFSIFIDKPFVVGQYLVVGDYHGTVENIGFKTTRLRALSGEQLIFSNSDLLASRIQNFGRLEERRARFSVGVTYGTSPEQMEQIPGMIREVIEAQPNARFDRSHFKEFRDSELNVESVYFVLVPDYQSFMDIQEQVNLEIMRRFAAAGIEFAYPTRTVHLEKGE